MNKNKRTQKRRQYTKKTGGYVYNKPKLSKSLSKSKSARVTKKISS